MRTKIRGTCRWPECQTIPLKSSYVEESRYCFIHQPKAIEQLKKAEESMKYYEKTLKAVEKEILTLNHNLRLDGNKKYRNRKNVIPGR